MKILVISMSHYGNNMQQIVGGLRQLGHTLCSISNHPLGPQDGAGTDYPEVKAMEPDIIIEPVLYGQWEEERKARRADQFNTFYWYLIPWDWVKDQWQKHQQGIPDLIIVAEGDCNPGGKFPPEWEELPVFYYGYDSQRGPDHHLRQAYCAHATAILITTRWYMPYYKMARHISGIVGRDMHHSGLPYKKVYWVPISARFPREERRYDSSQKCYDVLFLGTPGIEWLDGAGNVRVADVDSEGNFTMDGEQRLLCDGEFEFGEYRQRGTLFRKLMEEKDFRFHFRPSINGPEYPNELAKARIIWNCQGGYDCNHAGTTNRVFEAAASGAIPCTNWTDEICELWKPNEEAIIYPVSFCPWHLLCGWFDYALMRDMILDVLSDEMRQQRMIEACLERTKQEHLPIHRAQRIIDIALKENEVDPLDYKPL